MARTDVSYLDDLTIHLRMAGLTGAEIGALLEEARDHLEASGETPEEAFGPVEEYAEELVRSHRGMSARRIALSRSDLLAGAAQVAGWWGLVYGLVALVSSDAVDLRPGYVAGWGILTAGLAWPVWPSLQAFVKRQAGFVRPALAMVLVVAASTVCAVAWEEPVLAALPPAPVVVTSLVVIAACWVRAWRSRDPIRRPLDAS